MGLGLWALLVFIGLIVLWNLALRRNIVEAMFVGCLATAAFGGANAPQLLLDGLAFAATNQVVYAAIAFVFMAYVVDYTGVICKLINILNSLFGRMRGGAAYVSTIAAAVMGSLSGSNAGNTATTGAITVPWMIQSNFSRELSATIVAGNGGLGSALPPSSSMFILLGFAPVAAAVSQSDLYIGLLVSGIYQTLYRLLLVAYFVRRDRISVVASTLVRPLRESLRQGWTSTLIFLGALIPIAVTIGPFAEGLAANPDIGSEALDRIELITWIPILITLISFLVGWANVPKSAVQWTKFLDGAVPRFSTVGALLLFAFASSQILANLGLAQDLAALIGSIHISKWLMTLLVALLVVLVAGPLSSTATLSAIGMVAFAALVSVGVEPLLAAVAILMFASTEGSSPPASGSIFIAAALAGAEPEKTFMPLILYYVIPVLILGWLVGMGILPIPM